MDRIVLALITFSVVLLLNKIFMIKLQFDISMIFLWGKIQQYLPMDRQVQEKPTPCLAV